MERTIDFRKCLVHLRQEQGLSTPSSEILQNTHTHTTQWYPKALQLHTTTIEMMTLIRLKRKEYLDMNRFLNAKSLMSDHERYQLEQDITRKGKSCQVQLDELVNDVEWNQAQGQVARHYDAIAAFLKEKLTNAMKQFAMMHKQRQKQKQKIKLTPDTMKPMSREVIENKPERLVTFTVDEETELRMENQMYEVSLRNKKEDAEKIERQVAEIGGLMETFAQHVTRQEEEITSIDGHTENAALNMIMANEQLEKGRARGSQFGFYIFCYLVGMSMLLLLLHYFIP